MTNPAEYELYAIKYATRAAKRSDHFYPFDPHEGPMPMDYFVWVAVAPERVVVIDAGFTAEVAARRQRQHLRCPTAGLRQLGVTPEQVSALIVTHFHYDHIGNLDKFPHANYVVQAEEMRFWTGRYAGRGHFRGLVEPDDVLHLARENFNRRVHFVDGVDTVAPGITVHRVGGHAPGLQIVRVNTARGPVVVASDATHFYANLEEDRPFSLVHHLPDMYAAFDLINDLAESPAHIIPGHDPAVMARFPVAATGLDGIAVRLG